MLLSEWEGRDGNYTSGAKTADRALPQPVHFALVLFLNCQTEPMNSALSCPGICLHILRFKIIFYA